jgi:hypothetical protein
MTTTGEDIIWAMERLGFDDYVAALRAYVRRMRELESADRGGGAGAVLTATSWQASCNRHRSRPQKKEKKK